MLLPCSLIEQGPGDGDFDYPADEPMGCGEILLALQVGVNALNRVCAWLPFRQARQHVSRVKVALEVGSC